MLILGWVLIVGGGVVLLGQLGGAVVGLAVLWGEGRG